MNDRFQILVEPRPAGGDPATRRLAIRLGDVWLTQLIRRSGDRPDYCLEVPPLPLAFWFVDNWWRIHCEPPPLQRDPPARWRIAHHLPSVGAGYPWPNVSLWGEGSRCAVMVHADAHNLQRSLRFVAEPALDPGASRWRRLDALGPLSAARSGRQKFQRAFAQEFLCPFDDLRSYIPDETPADDDIHAAARHFHVSERLVQTTLVNHNVIDRETFEQVVEAG